MSDTLASVSKNVRKGTLFFLGTEFTLSFDRTFMVTHRQEYLMYVELVKKLKQKKYDDRRYSWTLPIAEDSVRCLNQLVGWGISCATSARERLGNELKKMADAAGIIQAATEKEVELTIPGEPGAALVKALKNYQRAGVKFMSAVKCSYNGDEMGLGKSLQLLATLEHENAYPAVIVCPVKLKENWLSECRKWLPHRTASIHVNALAEVSIVGYSEVHKYVNYKLASPSAKERKKAKEELAGKKFFFPDIVKPVACVCDEGHFIKHGDSRRTMAVTAIATLANCRVRSVLSGTPIENGRPAELIAPINFLGQMDRMGGWFNFVQRYCGATRNDFGMDISGATNTKELNERINRLFYIRRRKADVLKDLPDKIQSIYDVELSNREEYRKIESDIVAFLMNQTGQMLTEGQRKAQGMIKLGMLRKACGIGKVEWVNEWIDTFLENGEKFVIYAHHQEVLEGMVRGLSCWNPACFLAGCKDMAKEQDKFMHDKTCRLAIGSVTAAGFGLTLTAASHIGIVDLMWTDSKHQQAFDRVHRIGQKNCVNCYFFLAPKTIDDDMWDIVTAKARINASTLDGEEANKATCLESLVRKYAARN